MTPTVANFSSPEFIDKLRSRDHVCVDAIVRAYTNQLINAAFGLGFTDSDAQEVVQSVWVTFFEKVPNFEGRSHIRTFIFGILYNKSRELRRDRVKHSSADPFDEFMAEKFDETGHWIKSPIEPDKFLQSLQTMEIINKYKLDLGKNNDAHEMLFYFCNLVIYCIFC